MKVLVDLVIYGQFHALGSPATVLAMTRNRSFSRTVVWFEASEVFLGALSGTAWPLGVVDGLDIAKRAAGGVLDERGGAQVEPFEGGRCLVAAGRSTAH